MLKILEVIGRSTQGNTRPFICRASDDNIYFVKGRSANARSLVCEWVAGKLAKAFGLPIARFAALEVPEELVALGTAAGEPLSDLGVGVAFGSQRCDVSELTMVTAELVIPTTRADVAVFDWWIRNEDRTLTDGGGNPNLFWDAGSSKLWVIDHNLAFDPDFSPNRFLASHVFSADLKVITSDSIARDAYVHRFESALTHWSDAVASMPQIWHYADPEQTIPVDFDFVLARKQLEKALNADFWNLEA
jgi:hypothetical protein